MEKDEEKCPLTATELRRHAEERLRSKTASVHAPRTTQETQRLVHELEVHQIELEMQNAELRQARDQVEAALEKYTDLYDFAPVGYVTLDRSGIIIAVNLTGAGILGIERTLLIGRRFELFVANEARPHFTEFLEKVFASRNKESSEITLTAEGDVPRFVQIEAIASGSGQECHVAVIDVTERMRVEEEREQLLVQLEAVLNSINEGVIISDLGGKVLTMNPSALAIHEFESVEQVRRQLDQYQESFELSDLDGRPLPFEQWPLARAIHGERFTDCEVRVRRKDTGKSWIGSYSGTPVQIRSGNVILAVVTLRDITERKRVEEVIERLNTDLAARAAELEAVNRELEAFNYTVAHDLRKPLTVINGYCQALRELCGDKLNEQCNGYLREAYDGTWRMNRLIDALLDFSSLGHVEPRREPVKLSSLAHEVAAELKLAEPERRVTFLIADEVSVDGDASLLRVVLANLLGNAWKYTGTRDEGIIEFGTTEVDGRPAYFVRDNGAGFDMADADKLFIPFQRLPGAEACRGFGIGLATVERIIRRHGGKVWAEGVPGEGACLWFTLSTD